MKKVLKFYAEWCGPCKVLAPIVEKVLSEEKFSAVEFENIDIDDDTDGLCEKYKIRNIPVVIALDENDNVLDKFVGSIPEQAVRNFFEKNL